MTCREKLMKEHPELVNSNYTGGCSKCPHSYGYLPRPDSCFRGLSNDECTKCWDREIPETETALPYNLHKLIDESMAKKDRYITIYTSELGTTVSIYPISDEEDRNDG